MATSVYFNNYGADNEQRLFEDLIVESIKIMGFDGYYLANTNDDARDLLYGEDPLKTFTTAFPLELYLSSALEYSGEREFFSKFGLEIRNNVSVILSKRTFSQRVPQNQFTRPREGDLIYIPVTNGTGELFEIKFVDHTKDFFTLGRSVPYFYEIQLEKFKYSNESIDTGIDEIDIVEIESSYTIDLLMANLDFLYDIGETVYQGADVDRADVTATVAGWDIPSNILKVYNINGTFTAGENVVGANTGTTIGLVSYDPLDVTQSKEDYNNKVIQNEADQIIDFSESNPFGEI